MVEAEAIVSVLIGITILYYFISLIVCHLHLTKKRGGDYILRLKFLVLLISFLGTFFIIIYLDLFSMVVCFLYLLGFVIFIVIALIYRKSNRENFINNLAMVIDEVDETESFDIMDFLLPNLTFTAKSIIRYGPKKATRIIFSFATVGILFFWIIYYGAYLNDFSGWFFIFYIPVLIFALIYGYRKNKKMYRRALHRAKEGSYKEDYIFFG